QLLQRYLAGSVALLSSEVTGDVEQVVRQDAAQPGEQFALVLSLKSEEVAMGLQQGLLHEVRGIALGAEMTAHLTLGEQVQIVAIALEELLASGGIALAAAQDQLGSGDGIIHRKAILSRGQGSGVRSQESGGSRMALFPDSWPLTPDP